MPKRTTQASPYSKWLQSKQKNKTASSKDTYLQVVVSGLEPTSDEQSLLNAFADAFKKVKELKLETAPAFIKVLEDTRFPGWVRLALALKLDSEKHVTLLAKFSAALASKADMLNYPYQLKVSNENAFAALSPARRVRLVETGVAYFARISANQLVSTLDELSKVSWAADRLKVMQDVSWGSDFEENMKIFKEASVYLTAPEAFSALEMMLNKSEAAEDKPEESVKALIGALKKLKFGSWPQTGVIKGDKFTAAALNFGSEEGYHLGALAALNTSKLSESKTLTTERIRTLAGNEFSRWALIGIAQKSHGRELEVLQEVLNFVDSKDPMVKAIIKNMTTGFSLNWLESPLLDEVAQKLGPQKTLLLKPFIEKLAKCYGYTYSPDMNKIPLWTKEEISKIRSINNDTLAKAQGTLVESCFIPSNQKLVHLSGPVVEELKAHLLRLTRGDDAPGSKPDLAARAWLKKLSVRDLVDLMDISYEYISRCFYGYDKTAKQITDTVEDALALADTSEVNDMVVDALLNGNAPDNINIMKFVSSVNSTVRKA